MMCHGLHEVPVLVNHPSLQSHSCRAYGRFSCPAALSPRPDHHILQDMEVVLLPWVVNKFSAISEVNNTFPLFNFSITLHYTTLHFNANKNVTVPPIVVFPGVGSPVPNLPANCMTATCDGSVPLIPEFKNVNCACPISLTCASCSTKPFETLATMIGPGLGAGKSEVSMSFVKMERSCLTVMVLPVGMALLTN